MTVSNWKKILKQLKRKPAKEKKFLKHNKPKERKFGIAKKKCEKGPVWANWNRPILSGDSVEENSSRLVGDS